MNIDLADHIVLIAAPIYAAFLRMAVPENGKRLSAEELSDLRMHAINQALALRLHALEMPAR